jgi:hypothetical protein
MQAIASLSRGVGAALQGVVRGVVRSQATEAGPARPGGQEEVDSRLGNLQLLLLECCIHRFVMVCKRKVVLLVILDMKKE